MPNPSFNRLLDLSGKVAVVTGASQGIGASIARRFGEAGAMVLVHYRGHEQAAEEVVASITAGGGRATAAQADLSQPGQVETLFACAIEKLGGLDIAVNNAGSFPVRPLLDMDLREWQAVYADNVESAFLCTREAARHMQHAGGGAIVNIASLESLAPAPDHSHYGSAKAALAMFTRCAAQELGPYGIRVNAVSPGLIERPGIEDAWPDGVARFRAQAPLRRIGEPGDVADACLFLASAAARWISGHNLVVDGGIMSAKMY